MGGPTPYMLHTNWSKKGHCQVNEQNLNFQILEN